MRANQTDLWVSETEKDLEIYPKERPYLVGVSGGVDSRVLLKILLDAGFSQLVICHLDHRLRGSESERETDFIGRLARRLRLPIYQEQVKEWPKSLPGNCCSPGSTTFFWARSQEIRDQSCLSRSSCG